ncbi:DMP19 family protein [Luteolibacter luteus]|uniref:DMP19 family protein n=1 Tax=Luteolibacter luteus TaxID=2728835 RepID=A0A858RLJ3_9BACT|nr:DUF4375 domain-containing protein [Luteolibacter luteus]QJE98236.1 DMP19 family protein [Luteolibacter luteus]
MDATIQLVEDFEAEINNGGFDQFFLNSHGDHAAETAEALKRIGALHTAAILERTIARFPGGAPSRNWKTRQDQMLDEVSPDGEAFREEDKAFYKYEDKLDQLMKAYRQGS